MKSAPVRHAGYTIIEVMIFLVITAALLLSVVGLFSGQIQNAEFAQSVQALDNKIKSVANEASTGTYPDSPSFDCTLFLGVPSTNAAQPGTQGSRDPCIFAGKIINFDVQNAVCNVVTSDSCISLDTYTVVGRRLTNAGQVPTSLLGATGVAPRIIQSPNLTQSYNLGYGTHVSGVYLKLNGSGQPDPTGTVDKTTPLSGLAFFQSMNASYSGGNLNSSAQNIETWYVKGALNPAAPITMANMNAALVAAVPGQPSTVQQPIAGTLVVCVTSGGGDKNASITLGTSNGSSATEIKIEDPQCP